MAIDSDYQRETDCRFGGGNGDRENRDHNTGRWLRLRAEAPERDEIEVCRGEHHLDPDQNKDGVTTTQGRKQPRRKQGGRNNEERLGASVSPLLLHHENQCADQRSGEKKPDALQWPDITGHQRFTDSFNSQRSNVWGGNGNRLRLKNRPRQTAEYSNSQQCTAPVSAAIFSNITPGQENRKND